MFVELNKYKEHNHFFFESDDSLAEVCNAPTDKWGVFVVYALAGGKVELVFIGSSGRKQTGGGLNKRKAAVGGLKDRIVNGQFGKVPGRKAWPAQMQKENIEALDVYWWITCDDDYDDDPSDIEKLLTGRHFEIYGGLPKWNKKIE